MEFGQLQLNYIDWEFQDGKEKAALLEQYHLPIWVMEPLRGGRLARLSAEEAAPLKGPAPRGTHPRLGLPFPPVHPRRPPSSSPACPTALRWRTT